MGKKSRYMHGTMDVKQPDAVTAYYRSAREMENDLLWYERETRRIDAHAKHVEQQMTEAALRLQTAQQEAQKAGAAAAPPVLRLRQCSTSHAFSQ